MKRYVPCLLGFLGASIACESPLSIRELRQLQTAEARWAARPFQNYTIEAQKSCFCDPIVTQWARVEVLGGAVTRVVLVETGDEVASPYRAYFSTVEGVFAAIQAAEDT